MISLYIVDIHLSRNVVGIISLTLPRPPPATPTPPTPPPPLLTLTNYFINYWTFKKCVIKTRQAVSSKCGLSLEVLTDILESWHWPTILFHNEELENVSSKPAKCKLLIDEIISAKNVRAWVSMNFRQDKFSAPRTINKDWSKMKMTKVI